MAEYSFCPKCGGRLQFQKVKATESERLVCQSCHFIFFEDPQVAVGTIVTIRDQILLLRRSVPSSYGKWVFPGGYVDRGERVEDAAIRETREEGGLHVELTKLVGIYSYRQYPVIVIVFGGKIVSGDAFAGDETLEARYFNVREIPWNDLAFPSSGEAL